MRVLRIVLVLVFALVLLGAYQTRASAERSSAGTAAVPSADRLSPIWPPAIRQWSLHIAALADAYGLDPDFIAAVIMAESNGTHDLVSHAGAVGLMGVMPNGPGLELRPSSEELTVPGVNLRWGVSILADIIRQAGGDLYSALAAYSGGWDQANSRVPRRYAADVLDSYGRAVAARANISPDIATRWTIAVRFERGYIPVEPLVVLGDQPLSGLRTYGEHIVYSYKDVTGQAFHVRGYAVPLALTVSASGNVSFGASDTLEPELMRQIEKGEPKTLQANHQVLLACLPTLSRLRGRTSTRWFAPSSCPSWHR